MAQQTSTFRAHVSDNDDLSGVRDPDFLALGLGGTNMMSMLWSLALGRRAVGVEMRGDPFLGVHWNIRVDLFHQLGLIDQLMLERYGEEGVPRRANGKLFRLAECFYSVETVAGDIVADEVIDGYDAQQHLVGAIQHVEFIDDRWRDGLPHRVVTLLQPPAPPDHPDPRKIRTDIVEVLDGPSTFQAGAAAILILLRRYLERIEQMDLDAGREPRVRLFTRHRVIESDGFVRAADGRLNVRIEALQELDYKGKFVRVRSQGSEPIDIGQPELIMIAQGFHSSDAERLGFEQEDVSVDHQDGRGPVVAQADFLAGLIEVLVGGRLRRRISSEFDADGREYWVRQIAVGHENDPEVGWVLVQVPDFRTFDPIEAGLLPAGTDPKSPEFFAAYQNLVYDFYLEQSSDILELPKSELRKAQMVYGPRLFSLVERMGKDARVATNAVVAGDSFGNGHFLTSGGAMTGMVGHSAGVLRYWQARDRGTSREVAIDALAGTIRQATLAWLHVSAKEYSDAVPINFGAERIKQIAAASGIDSSARAHAIDASRRQRHSLLPLDPSDWRRLFLRNGQVMSAPLPELHVMHPALRAQRGTRNKMRTKIAYVASDLRPSTIRYIEAILGQPGVRLGLISPESPYALPDALSARIARHVIVDDHRDVHQIADAVRGLGPAFGKPDMLIGVEDDLQVTLARVRELLRITGLKASVAQQLCDREMRLDILREAGLPVAARGARTIGGGQEFTLEVMTLGRVPAWFSSTRRMGATIVLPREVEDPADLQVRHLGFSALRALGARTGISSLRWSRDRNGRPVILDIAPRPPRAPTLSLMSHSHGADMHRAWANVVVNGHFAPIPRSHASGAALVPLVGAGTRVVSIHGFEKVKRELGKMLVESKLPEIGRRVPRKAARSGEHYLLVRHPRTSTVEQAIAHVASAVEVELG